MLSLLAFASTAAAFSNYSISTEVVTAYTTFCPNATTFVEGTRTYTATDATTITVTDCPCTRTHTYWTETVTVCPETAAATSPSKSSSAAPALASSSTSQTSGPGLANGGVKSSGPMAAALAAIVVANLL